MGQNRRKVEPERDCVTDFSGISVSSNVTRRILNTTQLILHFELNFLVIFFCQVIRYLIIFIILVI